MSTDTCIFCKIVSGEIPATLVKQTDRVTVFHDAHPQAPTHLLVVPNTHVASLAETTHPNIFADCVTAVQDVARELGLTDFRMVVNNGAGAGQTVFHLHFHVLSGRPLAWPPG